MRALARVVRERRWREIRDVIAAELALVRAQLTVWTRPKGRLLAATNPPTEKSGGDTVGVATGERLAQAINRASQHGFFSPQCLVRAVALNRMLEAHGIQGSTIRIGVRWLDGEFIAHAWVERDGVILGDTAANTATFVPLTDARVSPSRGTGLRLGQ